MLTITEKSNAVILLRELGFKSLKEYANSKLYSIVKTEILYRDRETCRVRGCEEKATSIGYTNLSLGSLVGKPYFIFSMCSAHYKESQKKDPPNSEEVSTNTVFRLVSGVRKREGISNPKIGVWYKAQQSELNLDTTNRIGRAIQLSSPEIWERIEKYWIKEFE